MKATYNKPFMAAEELKNADVITASGVTDQQHGTGGQNGDGNRIAGHISGRH